MTSETASNRVRNYLSLWGQTFKIHWLVWNGSQTLGGPIYWLFGSIHWSTVDKQMVTATVTIVLSVNLTSPITLLTPPLHSSSDNEFKPLQGPLWTVSHTGKWTLFCHFWQSPVPARSSRIWQIGAMTHYRTLISWRSSCLGRPPAILERRSCPWQLHWKRIWRTGLDSQMTDLTWPNFWMEPTYFQSRIQVLRYWQNNVNLCIVFGRDQFSVTVCVCVFQFVFRVTFSPFQFHTLVSPLVLLGAPPNWCPFLCVWACCWSSGECWEVRWPVEDVQEDCSVHQYTFWPLKGGLARDIAPQVWRVCHQRQGNVTLSLFHDQPTTNKKTVL